MPVYTYHRVSTQRQADAGLSLDVQARTCAGYALMLGLEVTESYTERGVSGSIPLAKRPEGAALLAVLQPGDVVISTKLDRMFRSSLDALGVLAKLTARCVALHLIDLGGDVTGAGGGVSKLVFTILSAVAEAERDRTRERIVTVKTDQRLRGAYLGGVVPYGMRVRDVGMLEEDPGAQAIIHRARQLRGRGMSLRLIKETLGADAPSIATINRITRATK